LPRFPSGSNDKRENFREIKCVRRVNFTKTLCNKEFGEKLVNYFKQYCYIEGGKEK
jgi:hypothetical protein